MELELDYGPFYEENINIILWVVFIQLCLVFLYFSVDKSSQLAEDFQPLVVSRVGRENEPQPGKEQRCYQNLGGENENQIVEHFLGNGDQS